MDAFHPTPTESGRPGAIPLHIPRITPHTASIVLSIEPAYTEPVNNLHKYFNTFLHACQAHSRIFLKILKRNFCPILSVFHNLCAFRRFFRRLAPLCPAIFYLNFQVLVLLQINRASCNPLCLFNYIAFHTICQVLFKKTRLVTSGTWISGSIHRFHQTNVQIIN